MKQNFRNQQTVHISRGGFSLVELLTVMSIITLMAAILFPVFNRVRDTARRASCQSNLRQIGMAVQQYTQDYDERFMCGSRGFGAASGRGWAGQLLPYIKNTQLFTCPSDDTNAGSGGKSVVSYVYNYSMTRKTLTATEADVQSLPTLSDPTRTVLMTEARDASFVLSSDETVSPTTNLAESYDFNFYTVTGPIPGAVPSDSCAPYPTRRCKWDDMPRHLGGANYLAADGHVKWFPPTAISPGRPARTANAVERFRFQVVMEAEGTAVNQHAMTMSPM
jgi:prepilin-type processing-associated H-X9-DG protein/prepilin-type N-terminal cleavage/methylation domain-containing protein